MWDSWFDEWHSCRMLAGCLRSFIANVPFHCICFSDNVWVCAFLLCLGGIIFVCVCYNRVVCICLCLPLTVLVSLMMNGTFSSSHFRMIDSVIDVLTCVRVLLPFYCIESVFFLCLVIPLFLCLGLGLVLNQASFLKHSMCMYVMYSQNCTL